MAGLPTETAQTVGVLIAQFARGGTESLDNLHIFQPPEVVAAGGLKAVKQACNPADLLRQTKERMFAA